MAATNMCSNFGSKWPSPPLLFLLLLLIAGLSWSGLGLTTFCGLISEKYIIYYLRPDLL